MQAQEPAHLLVLELLKTLVPLAYGKQYRWGLQDDELIGLRCKELRCLRRADRHSDDDAGGAAGARGAHRREHGGAGGKPIIDQHD